VDERMESGGPDDCLAALRSTPGQNRAVKEILARRARREGKKGEILIDRKSRAARILLNFGQTRVELCVLFCGAALSWRGALCL